MRSGRVIHTAVVCCAAGTICARSRTCAHSHSATVQIAARAPTRTTARLCRRGCGPVARAATMAKKKKAPAAPPLRASPRRASRSSVEILASGRSGRPKLAAASLQPRPSSSWPTTSTGRGKSTRARRSWRSRGSSSRSRARARGPRGAPVAERLAAAAARRAVAAAKARAARRRRERPRHRRRRPAGRGQVDLPPEHLAGCGVVRCCQDVIGRSRCLALVEETVRAGRVAYVDRCDGYPEQRAPWVEIAKRCNVEVVALRFTADASTCIQRAKARAAEASTTARSRHRRARVI